MAGNTGQMDSSRGPQSWQREHISISALTFSSGVDMVLPSRYFAYRVLSEMLAIL